MNFEEEMENPEREEELPAEEEMENPENTEELPAEEEPENLESTYDFLIKKKKYTIPSFVILPMVILYCEMVFAINTGSLDGLGFLFIPLFAAGAGFFLSFLFGLGSNKVYRILSVLSAFMIAFIYGAQIVYHSVFGMYCVLRSVVTGGIGQVTETGIINTTLNAIISSWLPVVFLLAAPAGAFFLTRKKEAKIEGSSWKHRFVLAGSSLSLLVAAVVLPQVLSASSDLYGSGFSLNNAVPALGLLHTEALDFTYNILGVEAGETIMTEPVLEDALGLPDTESGVSGSDIERKPQIMDIDFAALAASEKDPKMKELDTYFAGSQPSYTNEYTGLFEGYNLIMITAESFSPYLIREDLMPTLYKMYNEGFQFTNFYNPIWYASTSDGEYQHLTGLIPKVGGWSLYAVGKNKNYMPFIMAQQFIKDGVSPVYAYHNHRYDYYGRNVSHPRLGYNYKGIGNGLKGISKRWPESDLEMMISTGPEYINPDKRFHAYYMTVSGHLNYSFQGNRIAQINKALVGMPEASEKVRAYYACQMEFDRAMENLLRQLEEAGVADKTVISIVPDHYPYGLMDNDGKNKYRYYEEILGHPIDPDFELYKSSFLLYCPGLKGSEENDSEESGSEDNDLNNNLHLKMPVMIDKPSCPVDVLPTLNNLFGFEFDSRLLAGRDILSDSPSLVLFENRNWIADKGTYVAKTKTFKPFNGIQIDNVDSYVESVNTIVKNKSLISVRTLENDYFNKVLRFTQPSAS